MDGVLAVTTDGTWLFDVRPAGRIGEEDQVKFAAAAELALACGWRYLPDKILRSLRYCRTEPGLRVPWRAAQPAGS